MWEGGASVPRAGQERTAPAQCATPGVLTTETARRASVSVTRAGVGLTAHWTDVPGPALARTTGSVSPRTTPGPVTAAQPGLGRTAPSSWRPTALTAGTTTGTAWWTARTRSVATLTPAPPVSTAPLSSLPRQSSTTDQHRLPSPHSSRDTSFSLRKILCRNMPSRTSLMKGRIGGDFVC